MRRLKINLPVKIVGLYILFGMLWIAVTDLLLYNLIPHNTALFKEFETLKGWFYVAITAWILYQLINQGLRTIERSTESVRQSEEKFSKIFHASPDGLLITCLDDNIILDANEGFLRLIQTTLKESQGHRADDFFYWEISEDRQRMDQELKTSGESLNVETWLRTLHHDLIPVQVSVRAMEIEGKNYILTTCRDISDRKQSEELLRQQARELTGLHESAVAVASTLQVEQVMETLAERMGRMVAAQAVGIYSWTNEPQSHLLAQWAAELNTTNNPSNLIFPPPAPHNYQQVLEQKKPLALGFAEIDPQNRDQQPLPIAELLVPLVVRDTAVGYIQLLRYAHPTRPTFTVDEIRLCQTLAADAAVALEHARLFQAEQQQRETAEALAEAARTVNSTLNPEQILEQILEQVARVVYGNAFAIVEMQAGATIRTIRWRGDHQMDLTEQITDFDTLIPHLKVLETMFREGHSLRIANLQQDAHWEPWPKWTWMHSLVGVPIRLSDALIGFLIVLGIRPEQFSPIDVHRLEAFAAHVATALHNARLFENLRRYTEELEERVQERTRQIQNQYAQSQTILNSTSDGILVAARDGTIQQANTVAQYWLKRTLPPQEQAILLETIQKLARDAQTTQIEIALSGTDLELSAAPILAPREDEEPTTVIAIHDVSHLKALNRMKLEFITNVSHELRTPVTAIKLYISLLQQSPPEKWNKYLEALALEAERQTQLIEAILQISRIDAGRLEIRPVPTSLNTLTENMLMTYTALAEHHHQTLRSELAPQDLIVNIDPEQFQQVLDNLITNALRYTPEGGEIVLKTARQEKEGHTWATLTVQDTGIGIPEKELPFIFDRFYRGETPRNLQIRGTGLGLAIVKELVTLHGGEVEVQSEPHKGSAFTIWLPLS